MEEKITPGKMDHTWKYGPDLKKMGHTWKNGPDFKKCFASFSQLKTMND